MKPQTWTEDATLHATRSAVAAAVDVATARPSMASAKTRNAMPDTTLRTRVLERGLTRIARSTKGAKANLPIVSATWPSRTCWPATTGVVPKIFT